MKTANLIVAIISTLFLLWIFFEGMALVDAEIMFGAILLSPPTIMNWITWNHLNK